jgi:hypothetical protein
MILIKNGEELKLLFIILILRFLRGDENMEFEKIESMDPEDLIIKCLASVCNKGCNGASGNMLADLERES